MFGDDTTAVQLFDPDHGSPPPDALDIVFVAPVSLSLLADALAQAGLDHELDQLRRVYLDVAAGVVADVQHHGGYVPGGHHGREIRAQLELAALAEQHTPTSATRLHTHLYVGRDAVAVDTGDRHPVALDRLQHAADLAWRSYLSRLVDLTGRELGYEWAALPSRHPGDVEIHTPPIAEHIGAEIPGDCPGVYGPREQIRADARWRAGIAEMLPYLDRDTPGVADPG